MSRESEKLFVRRCLRERPRWRCWWPVSNGRGLEGAKGPPEERLAGRPALPSNTSPVLPDGGEVEPLEESSWRPHQGECQLIIHLQHHLLESLSFLRSFFSKDFCDCPATTVGQSAIHDFCLLRTCRPSTHDPSAVSLLIHIVVISFRALSHCCVADKFKLLWILFLHMWKFNLQR